MQGGIGIAKQHLTKGQLVDLILDTLASPNRVGAHYAFDAGQIGGGDPLLRKPRQQLLRLFGQRLQRGEFLRVRLQHQLQVTVEFRALKRGARIQSQARLDQLLIEDRVLRAGQLVGEDIQRRFGLGARNDGGRVGDQQQRQLDVVLIGHVTRPLQRHRLQGGLTHRRPRRNGGKVALNPSQRLLRLEVTADGQSRVIRAIPAQEEALEIVDIHPIEIVDITDGLPGVGVIAWIERFTQYLTHPAIGLVIHGLTPFVLDRVTLDLKLLLAHSIEQKAHAIRLQPQHLLQFGSRNRLEVMGNILPGHPIQRAPRLFDHLVVLLSGHMLGALEHHVLEEVGKARHPLYFARGAHMVGHVDVHQRIRMVRMQDQCQTILQTIHLIGDGQRVWFGDLFGDQPRRSPACRHKQEGRENQQQATQGRYGTHHDNLSMHNIKPGDH